MKTKLFTALLLIFSVGILKSQDWIVGGNTNAQLFGNQPFIGLTQNNNSLRIGTGGIDRIFIQNNTGLNAGFVGIGPVAPVNPLMPVHIAGSGQATGQGWLKGLFLNDLSVIMWEGKNNRYFFLAHSSTGPFGNAWEGMSAGIGPSTTVDYSRTVWVNTVPPGSTAPFMSTQILKNLYLFDGTATTRRMGINTVQETNVFHIKSNVASGILAPLTGANANTRSGIRLENLNSTMPVDANTNISPGNPLSPQSLPKGTLLKKIWQCPLTGDTAGT